MSQRARPRFAVLPGVIEGQAGQDPSPERAVRGILAAHPFAPSLLSESRHRANVARDSAVKSDEAARTCRNAELGHELYRRAQDPHGLRRMSFWTALLSLSVLTLGCTAASALLTSLLAWPEQAALTAGVVVLVSVQAWRYSRAGAGRGASRAAVHAAAMSAPLVLVSIVTWGGRLALGAAVAVGLGASIVTATASAVLVLTHAEDWRSCYLRRLARRAARDRRAAADLAAWAESARDSALASWVSVVVEECQLAAPDAAVGGDWLARCVAVARTIARVDADGSETGDAGLPESGAERDLGRPA